MNSLDLAAGGDYRAENGYIIVQLIQTASYSRLEGANVAH